MTKTTAAILVIAVVTCLFTLSYLETRALGAYSYLLSKAGASAEEQLAFNVGSVLVCGFFSLSVVGGVACGLAAAG